MLPSIKSALLFDTCVGDDGTKYIALYKGESLVWQKTDSSPEDKKKPGKKVPMKNKLPSKPACTVPLFTVLKGGDGNTYIALCDKRGELHWQRHQTKYQDTSCVVTHIKV